MGGARFTRQRLCIILYDLFVSHGPPQITLLGTVTGWICDGLAGGYTFLFQDPLESQINDLVDMGLGLGMPKKADVGWNVSCLMLFVLNDMNCKSGRFWIHNKNYLEFT